MFEEVSRPRPVVVGAVAVVVALLAVLEPLRAWLAALAGPVVSLGTIVLVVLWLGDKV